MKSASSKKRNKILKRLELPEDVSFVIITIKNRVHRTKRKTNDNWLNLFSYLQTNQTSQINLSFGLKIYLLIQVVQVSRKNQPDCDQFSYTRYNQHIDDLKINVFLIHCSTSSGSPR